MAILWEGDEPGNSRSLTYSELLQQVSFCSPSQTRELNKKQVCRLSNSLLAEGVKKGDTVGIYMPMVPEAAIAMLACARIGAVHSVVFAGFSSTALYERLADAKAKVLITSDEGMRGGKHIPLKQLVDEALQHPSAALVQRVFVHRHTGSKITWNADRDRDLGEAMAKERPFCPPARMESEDPLFILYTSGSTGKPKGQIGRAHV